MYHVSKLFNTTFNNISVLLVEETGVPEKTTNLSQDTDKLDQIMLHRVGIQLTSFNI
jgi:hypothetical protein